MALDFTHDAAARSWLASANLQDSDFPIQNLPFGVFAYRGSGECARGGIAIGDEVLDLARLAGSALLEGLAQAACERAAEESLNGFMALGRPAWQALRHAVFTLLGAEGGRAHERAVRGCLVPMAQAEMRLPVTVHNYTDFYTSLDHALNCGHLLRPEDPLAPNFKWMPIAYHGRASSVVHSGGAFRRPMGQSLAPGDARPGFGPCARLDFELEMGFFVGPATQAGERIPLTSAPDRIFGMCLLNDWSARDHQFWEMNPLGPFLGKNFCTSISPWIVTMDALEPFRVPHERAAEDPEPLAYLKDEAVSARGGLDIQLEARIQTPAHRDRRLAGDVVTRTSFRHQYWTIAHMLAHHTVNGCKVVSGDLMGSGTVSGPGEDEAGSLVELTHAGARPLLLPSTKEERRFLEDGDSVVLRGWCERPGAARIGFGDCRGQVLPADPST